MPETTDSTASPVPTTFSRVYKPMIELNLSLCLIYTLTTTTDKIEQLLTTIHYNKSHMHAVSLSDPLIVLSSAFIS